MKGYYVIPSGSEEPIEVKTEKQAFKKAKELYDSGDLEVMIQPFNDKNPSGYFVGLKAIFIKEILI